MSESEQKGRCRSEVDRSGWGGPVTKALAEAIDRLAADVASIKEAVCGRSGWPVGWLIEADRLIRLRDEARAKVERLKNELYDREQEILSLRADTVERYEPPAAPQPAGQGISPGLSDTQPPQNAAPAAGWLTERERRAVAYFAQVCRDDLVPDEWTDSAGVLRSLLSRAGSPPVVVLPSVFQRSSLGDELVALQQVKDSLDKAGVKWKGVPRE